MAQRIPNDVPDLTLEVCRTSHGPMLGEAPHSWFLLPHEERLIRAALVQELDRWRRSDGVFPPGAHERLFRVLRRFELATGT